MKYEYIGDDLHNNEWNFITEKHKNINIDKFIIDNPINDVLNVILRTKGWGGKTVRMFILGFEIGKLYQSGNLKSEIARLSKSGEINEI